MDLIKIGKYIAGKRKSLGMTQKQLAEKLGILLMLQKNSFMIFVVFPVFSNPGL